MPRLNKSRRNRKKKGGLCLRSSNMDSGAPFHPQWGAQYCPTPQQGGKRKSVRNLKKKGGLCLRSSNMDSGAPFHPQWGSQYCPTPQQGGKRKSVRKSLRNRKRRGGRY